MNKHQKNRQLYQVGRVQINMAINKMIRVILILILINACLSLSIESDNQPKNTTKEIREGQNGSISEDSNHQSKQQSPQTINKRNSIIRKIIIAAQYLFIILIVATLIASFISLRKKSTSSKKDTNHIELVEDIVTNSQKAQV